MWILVTTILQSWWNKAWKYVTIAAAIVAAILVTYLKGRKDADSDNERKVLREDVENRREADAVRRDVDRLDDPAERLRDEWSRPGR